MTSNAQIAIIRGMCIADIYHNQSTTQDLTTFATLSMTELESSDLLSDSMKHSLIDYRHWINKLQAINTRHLSNLPLSALLALEIPPHILTKIHTELSQSTPNDNSALVSGYALVQIIQLTTSKLSPQGYMQLVWDLCGGLDEQFDMTLRKIGHVMGWGSHKHALRHLGDGSQPAHIITNALYSVMKYPTDTVSAIQIASLTDHNARQTAIITGAILGAKLGNNLFDIQP